MSEFLTKNLNTNFSNKNNAIRPQMTNNQKIKQLKGKKTKKNKIKPDLIYKKDNLRIKVKRKQYTIMNSRNSIKNSNNNNSFFSYKNSNKIIPNDNLVILINNSNNKNNENNIDKINKESQINNEKYTKDSDFYPKTFYINNFNNNYINIGNITIENNNEKSNEKEKEKDIQKNDDIKKSFSDRNILNKNSLKEEIIICDEKTINKSKDFIENKTIELSSGDKRSNLSCLLSSSKNNNNLFDSFYSKSKNHIYNYNPDLLNNAETIRKDKGKKKIINISLNYRNRNEINNIYSNKKFYHFNKTFARESKSVKNFLLDLRKNKILKGKGEKLNNSVSFRKIKKLKTKENDLTFYTDKIKKLFKAKNSNKIKENKILSPNLSLRNNITVDKYFQKHKSKLPHSNTKNNYKNNENENIPKNSSKNNIKFKTNNYIEHRNKEKNISKLIKHQDKLNNKTKKVIEKRNSLTNKFNKKIPKLKDKFKNKTNYNKINTNTKQFSNPLSLSNSTNSKKAKAKEYPNMVKKPLVNSVKERYTKKIKNLNVICKVGNSGSFQKKLNQDNYFITNHFLGKNDYTFVGVCDGHGVYGQNISSYLKEHLPLNVQDELIHQNILDLSNIDITKFSEIIESIYKTTNSQMNSDERIDSSLSGSTCISGLFTPSHFFCINVGDSRCVLFKFFKSRNYWTFSNLSRDHKPSDVNEKNRILNNGGKVESYIDEEGNHVGPERVWARGLEDRVGVPGLAMSRSFGDQVAHNVGVVVSPEILEHPFGEEDKVILLASDGIWEFLKNEEVLNIVKKYYEENNAEGALEEIYQEAYKRWMENEGIVDDITAIILFLE